MTEEPIIKKITKAAHEMRNDVLKMTFLTGNTGAHIGGGLSMIDILATLYLGVMKFSINNPTDEKRDRFILSKGHGALCFYAALNQIGMISKEDLWTFKSNETFLYGHPSINPNKGIEFSSGSLGQGLSLGVGVSLALKRKDNIDSKVYVLLGDGECNEGSVWEAAMSASHFKLDNLTVIIDKNGLQYDGPTADILSMEPFLEKWKSFGWQTIEVDGHSIQNLYQAFHTYHNQPIAIIANTIKGKGVSFMENNPKWHNSRLTQTEYDMAIMELEGSNID